MSRISSRTISGVTLEACTTGGHLTSWIDADRVERLWMSSTADCPDPGGPAIRGGIPVLFPQFGTLGPGIKHGFARTAEWSVIRATQGAAVAEIEMELTANDQTRQLWPHDFRVTLIARAVPGRLMVHLGAANLGEEGFSFSTGLHTYLKVPGSNGRIVGMKGAAAWEVATDRRWNVTDVLWDATEPRDVILSGVPWSLDLLGSEGGVRVLAEGFPERVVWNPGPGHGMADIPAGEEAGFVCIEPVSTAPIELKPGELWQGTVTMEAL